MAVSYAVSINIKHISTSPKARKVLSLADATATAKARFRYQTREAACGDEDVFCHSQGETLTGDKKAVKAKAYSALSQRAEKHNEKNGIRLCDTGHISLTNDATTDEQREIARLLVSEMSGDSSAVVVASIHNDRKGNKHLHWWAVDGLETREAAQARSPDAKRIRQRDQLRLNEGGSREAWREKMAGIVNQIAEKNGRRQAEYRSLKDQGIEHKKPQIHEGVEFVEKTEHGDDLSQAVKERMDKNQDIIAANIQAEGGGQAKQMLGIPKRWRLTQFLDSWRSKLGFLNRSEVQEEAKKKPANNGRPRILVRSFPSIPKFNRKTDFKEGKQAELQAAFGHRNATKGLAR